MQHFTNHIYLFKFLHNIHIYISNHPAYSPFSHTYKLNLALNFNYLYFITMCNILPIIFIFSNFYITSLIYDTSAGKGECENISGNGRWHLPQQCVSKGMTVGQWERCYVSLAKLSFWMLEVWTNQKKVRDWSALFWEAVAGPILNRKAVALLRRCLQRKATLSQQRFFSNIFPHIIPSILGFLCLFLFLWLLLPLPLPQTHNKGFIGSLPLPYFSVLDAVYVF